MRVDLISRRMGGPAGGYNGLAVAAAYLAFTLAEMGHTVRCRSMDSPSWTHPNVDWAETRDFRFPPDWTSHLNVTTAAESWPVTARAGKAAGVIDRLVYWHHHGRVPVGAGGILAAPPAVEVTPGWARHVVLAGSSWAAEAAPHPPGDCVITYAKPSKGGPLAAEVARLCPDVRWYVLPQSAQESYLAPWRALPNATIGPGAVHPDELWARARAVLSPTRSEVHPLLLVEAAARGLPIVCTDLPGCRAAAPMAAFLPMNAPAEVWAAALREALAHPPARLVLPSYREVVGRVLAQLLPADAAVEVCA